MRPYLKMNGHLRETNGRKALDITPQQQYS